ncbi:NAD(P)-dependent oxidoreductase [Salinifilum ghardaiensis]
MVENHPTVAVIGLGAMGMPMARHLSASFPVAAFDVAADLRAQAGEFAETTATSPAGAVRGADVVVLAVRDRQHVDAALFGADGLAATARRGTPVVLTSTVGPDVVRSAAERLAGHGLATVDAPVSGGPARAGTGELLVLVGAEDAALSTARPVLDALASTLTVVGPNPGDGQALKAINQLLAGVHIAAAGEAVALARELGLDPAVVVDALGDGAAGSFMLRDRGPRMLESYAEEGAPVRSRMDIFVKDMGIVTELARDNRVPAPLSAAAHQLYLLGERSGMGARDDSEVVRLLSPRSSAERDEG